MHSQEGTIVNNAPTKNNPLTSISNWFGNSKNTILFVIGFLLAWELAVIVFKIPRYILPSLDSVIRQFIKNFDLIWQYTLVTGMEAFIGFVIAIALGVPLAMLTGFSKLLRQTGSGAAQNCRLLRPLRHRGRQTEHSWRCPEYTLSVCRTSGD